MPYIDTDYYKNTYQGKMPADPNALPRIISRASDKIDIMTGYKINGDAGFAKLHPFQQAQVKKAEAVLAEYYVLNGGPEVSMQSGVKSASIGSFSFTNDDGKTEEVPGDVFALLQHSGLLYSGIDGGSF